jgi:hypothetical protein
LNLGGEGELPDVINQQPQWVTSPQARSSVGTRLSALIAGGNDFLFCRNTALPFPDQSVDVVFSDGVPIDINTWLGPGVQSTEIERILKSGGEWQHDGISVYMKP